MTGIPKFDLRDYADNKSEFAQAFGEAFRDYGFVIVSGHGIPDKAINAAARNASKFFELDDEIKKRYFRKEYVGRISYTKNFEQAVGAKEVDKKEEWFIRLRLPKDDPLAATVRDTFVVPELPKFQPSAVNLFEAFEKATLDVMRPLSLYMGLDENWFDDKFDHSNSSMRLLHYPTAGTAASHLDLNFLTWLRANKAGLYVTDRKGQEHAVVAKKGELILNGGMMLGLMTNENMKPSWHRVAAKTPRDTIVFFVHPNHEFMLSPLPKFQGEALESKPHYFPENNQPISAQDFLMKEVMKTMPKTPAPK